jgi:hypothetical protein
MNTVDKTIVKYKKKILFKLQKLRLSIGEFTFKGNEYNSGYNQALRDISRWIKGYEK